MFCDFASASLAEEAGFQRSVPREIADAAETRLFALVASLVPSERRLVRERGTGSSNPLPSSREFYEISVPGDGRSTTNAVARSSSSRTGAARGHLVGHALGQEPWEVLSFPAIAEADEVHAIETIWGPPVHPTVGSLNAVLCLGNHS